MSLVGSVAFGIPMVVEGGTEEVGVVIAGNPVHLTFTVVLVLGILLAVEFEKVEAARLFGLVPVRLLGEIVPGT